ncbi:MAG: cobaltochelatase subunit CobN [Acidobacteria bacterium]|nr:cobaltochelatase subunit CobN [Acidobacteriota bacterium]
MATRLLSACLIVCAWAAPAAAQQARVAFVFSDGNLPGVLKAYKAILQERPDLRSRVTFTFLTESMFDEVRAGDVTAADVLLLDIMNQQMLDRFNTKHSVDLIAAVRRRGKVFAVGEGLLPRERYASQGVLYHETARAFWAHSGFNNQVGLLKFLLGQAGVTRLTVPKPEPSLEHGYYYPDGGNGRVFATWDEFRAWRRERGTIRPGAPRVALGFFKASYYSGETQLVDAVIADIERRGAEAIPFFGYPEAAAAAHLLVDPAGAPRADVALALLFRFSGPEASPILEKVDIPVINLISLYGRTEQEWRASSTGLSFFEGTFQIAVPELAGLIAPTVVGSQEKTTDPETGLTIVVRKPMPSRVATAVQRGLKYAALRAKANRDKRVAIVFYNYPAGKANIGASYLNVAESLAAMLQRLAKEGYNVGDARLTGDVVLKEITEKARNVGGYAPGELQELVARGSAVRIGFAEYTRWLLSSSAAFRAKVIKDWGPPDTSRLMTIDGPGGPGLVIPVVQFGNVALLPQPARGWGEDREKMYHAKDLAPPHQYVAAYAWLRHGFRADAVVHVGTHGTLEWLDGKDIGLSADDASDALMADLPDIYIYNVDVVGEGLVARRRGMATLVDHMVPPFRKGGLYAELAELTETITDYQERRSDNPQLARAYADRIREQLTALGIARDLGLKLDTPESLTDEVLHEVEEHLFTLKEQNIPYGLHTFGRTPDKPLRDSTVDAIVSVDRSLLPNDAKVLAAEMEQRIVASGPRELDRLVRALGGRFVGTGGGGEPVRNPDAYPTGKNFYGIDPDKVPKPASWDMGVKLADQMLADHVKQHGRYPEKVSFVIWGDETMRHEGVVESQIFYLLGTRPIWDERGKVVDVRIIPRAQLNRPRVDIVIASAAEGMFHNVTRLMDEAVQRVKAIDEADNYVRRHYLNTKAVLMERGYSEGDADRRAGVRIFDEAPGVFNLNTSTIAASSGTWDTDKGMADDYLRKLGHAYGNGFWGEPMEDVFRLALSGTEKIVHSSSTALYGTLDNDDFFMYMGGLATAVRNLDGRTPEMVVTNTRDPGRPEMTTIEKFIGTEFRSRYVNPAWIEGMKKEGYAGAGEMRSFVEYLWGWDATAPEVIDEGKWQETFDVYVEDKHRLGLAEFFDRHSPFAYQDMTARMIETVRKGYWAPDASTRKRLLEEYVDSVNRHGVGCAEHTCGNPRLQKYVLDEGRKAGIPVPALGCFQQAMEKATGTAVEPAAEDAANFARQNDARMAANLSKVPAVSRVARQLAGYVMERREENASDADPQREAPLRSEVQVLLTGGPIVALLVLWRRRYRRAHR